MSGKRSAVERQVLEAIGALDRTGRNAESYRKKFAGMDDAAFARWMGTLRAGTDDLYLEVTPYENEPTFAAIEKAAKVVGAQLHQYVTYCHDDLAGNPVRTQHRVPTGYLVVRRLQQLLSKKVGYSTEVTGRNPITGQLSGANAVARVADEEVYAMKTVGANSALKEFFGPRSDGIDKRTQLYQSIEKQGYARYGDLTGDIASQPTLAFLDVMLTASGLKSDIVDPTLLLRHTVEMSERKARLGEASDLTLYHGSFYRVKELRPGFDHSGIETRWDKTESNRWLYATTDRKLAVEMGLASALAQVGVDVSNFSTGDSSISVRSTPVVDETILRKVRRVYLYTLPPDGFVPTGNVGNNAVGEYKRQGAVRPTDVESVDVKEFLASYDKVEFLPADEREMH